MSFSQRLQEIRDGFERLSYYGAFSSLANYLHESLDIPMQQTGVHHSGYTPLEERYCSLGAALDNLAEKHLDPSWEQKSFSLADRSGKLLPIAVPAGSNGLPREDSARRAVQIHQDAKIYTSLLSPGQSTTHLLAKDRRAYIFVIDGKLKLNGETLDPGDQARVTNECEL